MQTNKCHILLVDDNPDDRELVLRELNKELVDVTAQTVIDDKEWKQALDEGEFDLVITDYQLRWTDGISILKELKERYLFCPVIMFTGSGNEEVAVEAMRLGLDDYIVKKPTHFIRLRGAVTSALAHTFLKRSTIYLEKRFHSLLERLDVGIFRMTLEGKCLEANHAMYDLLGISEPTERPLLHVCDIFKDGDQLKEELFGALRLGCDKVTKEVQIRRADNDLLWCSLNLVQTTTADGTIVIDGMLEDISDRKRAEEKNILRAIARAKLSILTPREREVMEGVVKGKLNKIIATELNLSDKTIEKHRSSMMKRLGVRSVAELVKLYIESQD